MRVPIRTVVSPKKHRVSAIAVVVTLSIIVCEQYYDTIQLLLCRRDLRRYPGLLDNGTVHGFMDEIILLYLS